jgi:hypothetical protein
MICFIFSTFQLREEKRELRHDLLVLIKLIEGEVLQANRKQESAENINLYETPSICQYWVFLTFKNS